MGGRLASHAEVNSPSFVNGAYALPFYTVVCEICSLRDVCFRGQAELLELIGKNQFGVDTTNTVTTKRFGARADVIVTNLNVIGVVTNAPPQLGEKI